MLTEEELKKILEAYAEACEKAGKKIKTAVQVTGVKDGEIEGELLIDNRDKEDLN
jgi:hypothetical protein